MPKIVLSDAAVRALKPPTQGQIDHWDASFKAGLLSCRVSQGGTKTFFLKHDNRRYTIGRYPAISLAQAREEARKLLAEFTLGRIQPQSISYDQALKVFLDDKARSKRGRTVADYKRLLNRLGYHGLVANITPTEALRRLDLFKAEGERNHMLVAAKVFFNWCMKRQYIQTNPLAGLSQKQSPSRARVLSDEELAKIWRACEEAAGGSDEAEGNVAMAALSHSIASCRIPASFCKIVQLLIVTGQRRGEIAALQFSWIKENTITLPASVTKNGREHSFPISTASLEILLSLATATSPSLLFPARGQANRPFNGWSKSKAALDKASAVTNWTLHDLRRTFATGLADMGVAPHIIERLLNHVTGTLSPISLVYNRARYEPETRAAIELWDARIRSLCGA